MEKPSSEEIFTEISITPESSSEEEISVVSSVTTEGHLDCENATTCDVTSLSTEIPITLTQTLLVDIITSTVTNQMKVASELSTQEASSFSTEASTENLTSTEENTSEVISNLVTKTTDLFTPTIVSEYSSISMKSLESTPQAIKTSTIIEDLTHEPSTEYNITDTMLDIITRPSVMKSTEEETDSTKKITTPIWMKSTEDTTTIALESDKTDYSLLDRTSTVPSEINKEDVTTEKSTFVELVEEGGESDKVLDKLSKSAENITNIASMRTTTIGSSESIETTPSESLSIDTSTTELLQTSERISSVESEESSTEEIKKTTSTQISTEEFVPMISTSAISNIITTTLPTPEENELDYMCSNSDDCASTSTSEVCDESEDCSSSKESCESGESCEEQSTEDKSDMTSTIKIQTSVDLQSSEGASEGEQQFSSTTIATLISEEVSDNNTMTISNIPTTVETRRSTPLSTTNIPRHKLILKIKVLLEHVNEKEEKEKLVEVEKQLSLDENPEHHQDPNFFEQLKSSNESISMEAIHALLNCTSLGNLTNVGFFKKRLSDNINPDIDISSRSEESQYAYSADPISEQSSTSSEQVTYEDQYPDFDEEYETRKRKRRGFAGNREDIFLNVLKKNSFVPLSSNFINPTGTLNANSMREDTRRRNKLKKRTNNAAHNNERNEIRSMAIKKANNERRKMEIVRRALPEVAKDLSVGLRDVMSQLTRHDSISANNPKKKVNKMNLLDIIADPKDNRFHSRRKRAATEEIGRWSNERIRKMPTGGNLRSFTEFVLYDILS
jgi:hypothetical protein